MHSAFCHARRKYARALARWLDQLRELLLPERAQRCRAHISLRAECEQRARQLRLVGGFDEPDEVVGTKRPVDVLDPDAGPLPLFGRRFDAAGRVLVALDPLLSPVEEHDVGRHCLLLPRLPVTLSRRQYWLA